MPPLHHEPPRVPDRDPAINECAACGEPCRSGEPVCPMCGAVRPGQLPESVDTDAKETWFRTALRRRRERPIQTVVACIVLAVVGWKAISFGRQYLIARELEAGGAVIKFRYGNVIAVSYSKCGVLGRPGKITPRTISLINRLPHRKWLNFDFSDVTDSSLKELHQDGQLESLSVAHTPVTMRGLCSICRQHPKLNEVRIDWRQASEEAIVDFETEFPHIGVIQLQRTPDEGL